MYKYSIWDPLNPNIIDMGDIQKNKVWDVFINFPWKEYSDKMENAGDAEFYYSPTLEIENKENKNVLAISLIDIEKKAAFLISYKRPKAISKIFGLIRYIDNDYLSDTIDQTEMDVHDAVKALIQNDLKTLTERWG